MIDLRNKNVLIVGSGCDLIGRRMSKWINDFDGVVIRVNKRYGDPLDVGTRCDLWVTRWLSWIGNITPSEAVDYVVLNDYQGITAGETEIIR